MVMVVVVRVAVLAIPRALALTLQPLWGGHALKAKVLLELRVAEGADSWGERREEHAAPAHAFRCHLRHCQHQRLGIQLRSIKGCRWWQQHTPWWRHKPRVRGAAVIVHGCSRRGGLGRSEGGSGDTSAITIHTIHTIHTINTIHTIHASINIITTSSIIFNSSASSTFFLLVVLVLWLLLVLC